ncbi:hypothetical protein FisN_14Hu225 [Fistulifera solaris]|uniref:Uncharacterized protein n=1 Tax=Fistulifera solaris TaxID=1519565 RepID=A0A1Z5K8J1_FISSO|nr:hypothetical protein FisN_14Hu225 [Fistulifera solaris]|eukprot:GAX22593.1 hypothetical protein FisN_14Hu225 [Fistulifera solaris]
MTYEIPDEPEAILDTALPPEMQKAFRALFCHPVFDFPIAYDRKHEPAEEAAMLLYQDIKKELSAHPILARTINLNRQTRPFSRQTLLEKVIVDRTSACRDTIQFLIEANPHALIWEHGVRRHGCRGIPVALIHLLGESYWGEGLLPWIVDKYPWVFQHPLCQKFPPHIAMVRSWVRTQCDLETVRNFYKLYPQGLREKEHKSYPLWVSLRGYVAPNSDFFIWMAKQYPEAVYYEPSRGYTLLHDFCVLLAKQVVKSSEWSTMNVANIFRFLVSEHPSLVRQTYSGWLPIHFLARSCEWPIVQEVVILLLRAYPESVRTRSTNAHMTELSQVPFIQAVHPFIVKELEIDDEIALLNPISENLIEAASVSTTHRVSLTSASDDSSARIAAIFDSLSIAFQCWANQRVDALSVQKQQIAKSLDEAGKRFLAVRDNSSNDHSED